MQKIERNIEEFYSQPKEDPVSRFVRQARGKETRADPQSSRDYNLRILIVFILLFILTVRFACFISISLPLSVVPLIKAKISKFVN